jgi:hypothetical protein
MAHSLETTDYSLEAIKRNRQERLERAERDGRRVVKEVELSIILGVSGRWVRELRKLGVLKYSDPIGRLFDARESVEALSAAQDRDEAKKELAKIKRQEAKRYGSVDATPGVYLLFRSGELIYIGQSVDVHARIKAHKCNGRKFDFAAYGFCFDPDERSNIERQLIERYRPAENTVSNPDRQEKEQE